MLTERTIKREIRAMRRAVDHPGTDPRSRDQCYGAMEALRWVIGDGPPLNDFVRSAAPSQEGDQ